MPLWSDRRAAGKGPLETFPPASLTPARRPAGLMTLAVTCQWLRSGLCLQASLPSQNRQMVMWGQVVQMNFSVNDKHSQCKTRNTYFLKQKLIQDEVLKSGFRLLALSFSFVKIVNYPIYWKSILWWKQCFPRQKTQSNLTESDFLSTHVIVHELLLTICHLLNSQRKNMHLKRPSVSTLSQILLQSRIN